MSSPPPDRASRPYSITLLFISRPRPFRLSFHLRFSNPLDRPFLLSFAYRLLTPVRTTALVSLRRFSLSSLLCRVRRLGSRETPKRSTARVLNRRLPFAAAAPRRSSPASSHRHETKPRPLPKPPLQGNTHSADCKPGNSQLDTGSLIRRVAAILPESITIAAGATNTYFDFLTARHSSLASSLRSLLILFFLISSTLIIN